MHLVDAANGVLGATGVVAGNLSLAAGAAWAAQAQGKTQLSAWSFSATVPPAPVRSTRR